MAINWIESEIIEHTHWTDTLSSLRFKGNVLPYKAGQFTKVGLKIDGEVISRPYSYVSAPEDGFLEIVYVSVPDGILTPELQKLKIDDKILVMDKATGFFVMDEVPDGKNLWMLATGTGLGVFISLLKTDNPWKRFEKIVLVHCARFGNELIYQEQIESFNKKYGDQFTYIKSTTREKVDGCLGIRIPQAIEDNSFEEIANTEINKDSQFMICGNPDMINDTVEILNKSGLERNRRSKPGNITLEKYW
tara:strand:+ start:1211 stop:1954 length:744 start_codon:yes stop_codon:yes gene_type:complete